MSILTVILLYNWKYKSCMWENLGYLNKKKRIVNIRDVESKFRRIFKYCYLVGVTKGTMDKESLEFTKSLKNKNLYFLGTLGAKPDSEHWKDVLKEQKTLRWE